MHVHYCAICNRRKFCKKYLAVENNDDLSQSDLMDDCAERKIKDNDLLNELSENDRKICIAFVFACQELDLFENFSKLLNAETIWEMIKALTNQLVDMHCSEYSGIDRKALNRRTEALKCIYPLVDYWIRAERDHVSSLRKQQEMEERMEKERE